ncbi:MAG: Arc family DNA-binding protein, partial [Comamonas sp.]
LKEQIEAAAKQSGRSMNSEIVARLEGSLGGANASANAKMAIDTHIVLLESQSAMNEMRIRMAKFQLDHLASRLHGLERQPMKPVSEMSNAELDAFEAGTTEIGEVQAEISALHDELCQLQIIQKTVLESIEKVRPAIQSRTEALETAISARPKKN